MADCILAEDTRHSHKLLSFFGITTQLYSFHEHNEHAKEGQARPLPPAYRKCIVILALCYGTIEQGNVTGGTQTGPRELICVEIGKPMCLFSSKRLWKAFEAMPAPFLILSMRADRSCLGARCAAQSALFLTQLWDPFGFVTLSLSTRLWDALSSSSGTIIAGAKVSLCNCILKGTTAIPRCPTSQNWSLQVLDRLARGNAVALISDAGMPAVSDPGAKLISAAVRARHSVIPVPGERRSCVLSLTLTVNLTTPLKTTTLICRVRRSILQS